MAKRDDVLAALNDTGKPVCDDCLVPLAGLASRQQANAIGRALKSRALIVRGVGVCSACGKSKTVSGQAGVSLPQADHHESRSDDRPWYWEGNVQDAVVDFLSERGFRILSAANTATKEAGVDIIASGPAGTEWWITVKGYPERKPNKVTNPSTQARHWFSHAMFDIVVYRSKEKRIALGVALPDGFKTYHHLREKASWLHESAPFTYFWVGGDGSVRIECASGQWQEVIGESV